MPDRCSSNKILHHSVSLIRPLQPLPANRLLVRWHGYSIKQAGTIARAMPGEHSTTLLVWGPVLVPKGDLFPLVQVWGLSRTARWSATHLLP